MWSRISTVCLVAALTGAAACKSNDNPNSASQTATFTQALSATNEVPLSTGAETAGSGNATITLTYTQDASGNVTSASANFQVTLSGFPASTVFTMAHIHQAAVGVSGAIVVNTGLASGSVALTNGAGGFTINNINVPSDIAQSMLSGASGFYFNVHTQVNASGVVRGQLVRVQ
jgi:hypothetical protein